MMMMCRYLLLLIVFSCVVTFKLDDRRNFWLTWANLTGTTDFCLHLSAATDPFRTCLIGIPGFDPAAFSTYSTANCLHARNVSHCTALLLYGLHKALPWDPQELTLLGSRRLQHYKSERKTGCVNFGHWNLTGRTLFYLTPKRSPYWNSSYMCGHEPYGWRKGQRAIFVNKTAWALPPGIFLICGDRAWQGIPRYAQGGPCYFGSLTMLLPNNTTIKQIQKSSTQTHTIRDVSTLSSDCNDEVSLWSHTARFFGSLVPMFGTAHALTTLEHLACWVAKQANVTTAILSQMSQDLDSIRQAVLQNRAAIDYLLLAQGQGCEDIQGMCCFNISNHSNSIHKQLQWLKDHTKKITVNHNPLDDWLLSLGLTPWVKEIVKTVMLVVFVIVVVCLFGPCLFSIISSRMTKLAETVFDKRGGDAEAFVGALSLQPLYRKLL